MKTSKKSIIYFLILACIVVGILLSLNGRKNDKNTEGGNNPISNNGNSNSTSTPTAEITLKPVKVSLKNGKNFSLNIPENYNLTVAAEGFRHARFMAQSPDGRLFFGDMTSASDSHTGKVYALSDFDQQSGTFKIQNVYLDNLRNPNSLAFYTDGAGQSWIYIALTDKLIRYPYNPGDNSPTAPPQTIATFPDTPHSPPQGYWHLTRTVIIHDNKIYVSIGSSCDSCEETEDLRGVILKSDLDGSNQKVIATGLRNAVGLEFAGYDLFATDNQPDKLGDDKPNDIIYKITEGTNYGWPYCYQFQNQVFPDDSQSWNKNFDCSTVPLAWAAFAPHSAPLGLAYFDNNFADPLLRGSILTALHGSGNVKIGTGNSVSLSRANTPPAELITGFYQNKKRFARPVDILLRNNSSFFVTDDLNGVIYYLSYQK